MTPSRKQRDDERLREKYSDPNRLLYKLKHYEKDLQIDWNLVLTCSVSQLDKEMVSIGERLRNLCGDKVLAEMGQRFLHYVILKKRLQGRD